MHPKYSIPHFDHASYIDNPHKIDDGSFLDYKAKHNSVKRQYPHYSFGYSVDTNYTTASPPPNAYDPYRSTSNFNK